MPAVIAHDLFGRDTLESLAGLIGTSTDVTDAFLLGNQGPDVLFFSNLNPPIAEAWDLGSTMHRGDAETLLDGFIDAARSLAPSYRESGEAYALGMVGHYVLDSTLHPYIYALQDQYAHAGVAGLDESAGHEIHAEIESELDILALSAKTGKTIQEFEPSKNILKANDPTLRVISLLYKRVAAEVYGLDLSEDAYLLSLRSYRRALQLLYSPNGLRRSLLGRAERLFRKHSFLQAMSHRNELLESSIFDNEDHNPWRDPDSGSLCTDSFWDLYNTALEKMSCFAADRLDDPSVKSGAVTDGRNFNGVLTRAKIIAVE